MAYTADYRVVVRKFLAGTFGPGDTVVEIENAKNIGWSDYANDVPEAFFTINQADPKVRILLPYLKNNSHVAIWRNNVLVWRGWPGEIDETAEDAVVYCHGYVSTLYSILTTWPWTHSGKTVAFIVTDAWNRARGGGISTPQLTSTRAEWMTTGTIQAPPTTSGGAIDLILPLYKVYRKRLLFVMREMAAFSISDTTNRVLFEITPAGVFNFWKNRGVLRDRVIWDFGGGEIAGYTRHRMPVDRRNSIYGIGSSPTDPALQVGSINASDITTYGRMEDAVYFANVRDAAELLRVTTFRRTRAQREDAEIGLVFYPGRVDPTAYNLTDSVLIKINNGLTQISEVRLITGKQTVLSQGEEHVRMILRETL